MISAVPFEDSNLTIRGQPMKYSRTFICEFSILFLLCTVLSGTGCTTMDPFSKSQSDLEKSIRLFNRELESRSVETSSLFVSPPDRQEYLTKMHELKDKITFYESSVLDLKFYKDNIPISVEPDGKAGPGFDMVVATMRYKFSVSPATQLKTKIVHHEWKLLQNKWFVIPDINMFLE